MAYNEDLCRTSLPKQWHCCVMHALNRAYLLAAATSRQALENEVHGAATSHSKMILQGKRAV